MFTEEMLAALRKVATEAMHSVDSKLGKSWAEDTVKKTGKIKTKFPGSNSKNLDPSKPLFVTDTNGATTTVENPSAVKSSGRIKTQPEMDDAAQKAADARLKEVERQARILGPKRRKGIAKGVGAATATGLAGYTIGKNNN